MSDSIARVASMLEPVVAVSMTHSEIEREAKETILSEFSMIDLFAGAGGLSAGLSEAGFKVLYANELQPTYAQTYSHNHPDVWVQSRDIRKVNAAHVRRKLGLEKGELSLIAGGPPCQGFSINAPKRSSEDQRNHLFKEYLKFVDEFRPKISLIENVPGLVSFEEGKTLEAILESFDKIDYSADVKILYAPHYGVPQTRWRTLILAVPKGTSDPLEWFPDPSRSAPMRVNFTSKYQGRDIVSLPASLELPRFTSVEEAIGDLPPLANGEIGAPVKEYYLEPQSTYQRVLRAGSSGVRNHEASRLSSKNLDRFKYIQPGGNWTDIPFELLPKGMQRARRSDHTKRYGRVEADGLASTILTKCDPHWGAYIHYSQDRAFTVREAARIQSFPDTFEFTGSRIEQFEQVGNAVPPLLAAAVGHELTRRLNSVRERVADAV